MSQGNGSDTGLIGQAPQGNGSAPIDCPQCLVVAAALVLLLTMVLFLLVVLVGLTGDPASDYDLAYGYMLQSDYVAAEQSFQQFVSAMDRISVRRTVTTGWERPSFSRESFVTPSKCFWMPIPNIPMHRRRQTCC